MSIEAPFRYRKLGYVALTVTQLERSVRFYRDLLGLELVEERDGAAFLRCSNDHYNVVLYQGVSPGLRRVAWELESQADAERAFARFDSLGLGPCRIDSTESTSLRQGTGFRVRVPGSGLEFEYYGITTVMAREWTPTVAKIARLGHVVIGSNDLATAKAALLRDFGFVESDFVEDRFSFMRCFPNPFHHTFAVGASEGNHLHHINFMVTDIDDVGRAWHRMTQAGVKIAFGIGRHPPSGSVFLYFYDPDGMTVEYSFGMEEFPETGARQPRMLEPVPASLDTWGAVPDVMFGKVGAIEAA
jgi:2,3-dihydroxy-p-cumate/2,3-dihydroxybenzoate 3,4-dioxygenase